MLIPTVIICLLIWKAGITHAQCHYGCPNNDCVANGRNVGYCSITCKDGYYGKKCNVCSFCLSDVCDWNGVCSYGCKYADTYGVRCDENCPENCNSCDNKFDNTNTCLSCLTGYYGTACEHNCPPNCLYNRCYKNDGDCRQGCNIGYAGMRCDTCSTGYGLNNNLECVACIAKCQTCISYNICDVCKPGFYGNSCTDPCPIHCLHDVCNKGNGDCSEGCDLGYEGNKCSGCIEGYYLYTSDLTCNRCYENCKSCSYYYKCDVCIDGFYGGFCQTSCSTGCKYDSCLKSDGTCHGGCKTGYKGNKCDQCLEKYFMANSQCIGCPLYCEKCTSQKNCTLCSLGYYGQDCQNACATGCTTLKCNQTDGSCICRDGFNAAYNCRQCEDGKFGDNCDRECPSDCVACSSTNNCSSCTSGFYGSACKSSCSVGCAGDCDIHSGICDSCIRGYYGDRCCVQNDNCKSCSSNTKCMECFRGFYGTTCEFECPENCFASCAQATGHCNVCKDGYFGSQCTASCSDTCLRCSQNGTCLSCKNGFYGSDCQRRCMSACVSCSNSWSCDLCYKGFTGSTCSSPCASMCSSCSIKMDSYCLSCAPGRYSMYSFTQNYQNYLYCDSACSAHCLYGICDERTGKCTNGCLQGYDGDTCQCPDNCMFGYCRTLDATCTKCEDGFAGATCSCSHSLCKDPSCSFCVNNTLYASSGSCCKCSGTCKDNICSSASTCQKGCVKGYYGNGCTKRCLDHDSRCLSCTSTSCSQCVSGYFPSKNNILCIACSSNCLNRNCSSSTGECLEECALTYWGDDCSKSCDQDCKQCDRHNGTCIVCKNDKFGRRCSSNCNHRCLKNGDTATCNIDNGSCLLGCITKTLYGSTCQLNCSDTCIEQECYWTTGQCSLGCVDGYHGKWCDNRCSDNCIDITNSSDCDSVEGTCFRGCKNGYFAHDCEAICGKNCMNTTCKQDNGDCIHGCLDGFEGNDCAYALEQSGDNNTGVVAGAAAGGAVFLLLIAAVFVVVRFMRRRRGKKAHKTDFSPAEKGGHANIAMDDMGHVYTNSAAAVNMNSDPGNFSNATYQNHVSHISLNNSLNLESDPDNMDTEEARRSRDICSTTNQPMRAANEMALPIVAASGESSDGEEYLDEPIRGDDDGDTYYNTGAIRRMAVDRLANYVANKSDEDFKLEFGSFPKGLVKPYAVSQLPGNVKRNRYNKVYPYDENRLKLQNSTSDYINASYIDGFERKNEYIAALGPTRDTTDHFATFWSMIWQQKVEKLVMLTNLQEGPKMKCHQYWPNPGEGETYGDVTVTCMAEDTYAEYTVRTLSAIKDKEKRVIYHLHYTGWPDRGVPDDVTGLIEFRNKVLRVKATLDGPVLVHCSAGVGRTGTYIALDYLTNEGEETESVDVFDCVSSLRQQRIWMVQAEEQYVYLHDAVVHTLTFDSHPIQSDKFLEYVKSLTPAKLDKMYSHLKSGHRQKDEEEVKAVAKNKTYKNKNNTAADIPGDRYRPRIHLSRAHGECDYINAVYLNSFWFRNHYIAAQTSLTSTVDDFLTLLFQEHIPCIVDMQPNHSKQKNIGEYLPADNQKVTPHRDFAIRSIKVKSNTQFTLRRLIITRNSMQGPEERTFHHYQFVAWQDNAPTPPSPEDFINFVREVEAKSKEDFDDAKILVHCLTGAGRSCLFPAVSVMLQKMESEQEVSVVNTVRQIQSRRPSAIPDKEQYLFCHECIRVFLDSFDTYSNFAMR